MVQKAAYEFFIDDRLRWSGRVIEVREIPTGAEGNSPHGHITPGNGVGQSPVRRRIAARMPLYRERCQRRAMKIERYGGRNGRSFHGRQSAQPLQQFGGEGASGRGVGAASGEVVGGQQNTVSPEAG